MNRIDQIKRILGQHKKDIFSRYPLESMAIFGSVSRNEESEDSDVDIMVSFHSPIGMGFITLANELEKYLDLKVDLVSKGGIKDYYFEAIKDDLIYV